jgi:hypothetical protein
MLAGVDDELNGNWPRRIQRSGVIHSASTRHQKEQTDDAFRSCVLVSQPVKVKTLQRILTKSHLVFARKVCGSMSDLCEMMDLNDKQDSLALSAF